jgi:chromosome segregation ATPase
LIEEHRDRILSQNKLKKKHGIDKTLNFVDVILEQKQDIQKTLKEKEKELPMLIEQEVAIIKGKFAFDIETRDKRISELEEELKIKDEMISKFSSGQNIFSILNTNKNIQTEMNNEIKKQKAENERLEKEMASLQTKALDRIIELEDECTKLKTKIKSLEENKTTQSSFLQKHTDEIWLENKSLKETIGIIQNDLNGAVHLLELHGIIRSEKK